MKLEFLEEIKKSGYIHRPLPLHEERSLETRNKEKEVLDSISLEKLVNRCEWNHRGIGEIIVGESDEVNLKAPTVMNMWPEGAPEDGDYSNFGKVEAFHIIDRLSLEEYNRISLEVYPNCDGVHSPRMTFSIKNDGDYKIPDEYYREGFSVLNLKNNQWNNCIIELSGIPRDCITEIALSIDIDGKDRSTGDLLRYNVRNIVFEKVKVPEIAKGWIPIKDRVIYSHSGYNNMSNSKIAILSETECSTFDLVDSITGKVVFSNNISSITTHIGEFRILNFSEFNEEGEYYLSIGNIKTEKFIIGNVKEVWENSIWKSLNFIFCERCGYPVHGKHGVCHGDITAEHNGKKLIYNGGWHDAGDLSQQLVQTAELTYAIFEIAKEVKKYDQSLYLRLVEEGEWGLDFILKSRFGDGYRATSVGITIWTDGLLGNMDDMKARVHNQAYENFICSGIEAFIAMEIEDKMMAEKLISVAKEDFKFAFKQYKKVGFDEKPIFWEHTYMTSESLYMATASWAASMLYKLTNDRYYADKAKIFISYVIDCQQMKALSEKCEVSGFFYRNTDKKVIQHFNHQAREHMYIQALALIYETQKGDKCSPVWLNSIKLYGEYIKKTIKYSKPYKMIPSGIYKIDEYKDKRSFCHQHLLIDDKADFEYVEQLKNGVKLDEEYYLKRFPVWFSFRGNSAVILSMGKAAAICGKLLKDQELIDIAEGQLQWIVGNNPFGQSLMYGEGHDYAQQYAGHAGEMTGAIPVGVQTKNNDDDPYWPQMTNATYKEVWVGNAGKWLSIVSELFK